MISNQKIKTMFMDWLGYLITGILAVAYVLIQSMGMKPSNVNIGEVLTTGALYFIVTTLMRTSMMNTGVQKGYASEQWKATATKHEDYLQQCMPYIDTLPQFLDEDYMRRLKRKRFILLRGIAYEKIFNDDGTIKDYTHPLPQLENLNKKQQKEKIATYRAECRNIRRSRRASVPLYRSEQLFTRGDSNKRMFTVNPKRTVIVSITSGFILSVGTTIINLLFSPDGFSWAAFLSSFGMALVAVAMSLMPLHQGYALITQSLREDVIDKIHYLGEFQEWAKKQQIKGNLQNGQNAENNQVGA